MHIIQCLTPILRIVEFEGISKLIGLSLVNVKLRQSHLKLLLKEESNIRYLDLSMNK